MANVSFYQFGGCWAYQMGDGLYVLFGGPSHLDNPLVIPNGENAQEENMQKQGEIL